VICREGKPRLTERESRDLPRGKAMIRPAPQRARSPDRARGPAAPP
jgi:hypothetical protein